MGEFELLARIKERLPSPGERVWVGMGDDAAIATPGGATATSVDAIVEGVHFRREHGLAAIGHKALATALSDLAAMGAEPGEAYVVLGVPPGLDEDGCLELVDGMLELAEATGTTLAGGDVTRSPALIVAMTVVGHAAGPELLVTRGGARPGDVLVLTGEIGGAAAGLLLMEDPRLAAGLRAETAERLRERQLRPQPRLATGRALARAGATAMIDLSDGLGGDAQRLAEESRVAMRVEAGALRLAEGVAEVAAAAGRDALELAVGGGEDYELLAALPPERLAKAAQAAGEARCVLARVGEVGEGEATAEVRLPGGRLLKASGFDQLR
jgi:thiamine-monophosphate kinase